MLHPAASLETAREFTAADNKDHGELWTPVVLGDDMMLELTLPAESRHDYELHVTRISAGYRMFGQAPAEKQAQCEVDVVCPEGDDWWDEIDSLRSTP